MNIYQTKEWAEVCSIGRRWHPHFLTGLNVFERESPRLKKKQILFSEGVSLTEKNYQEIKELISKVKPPYILLSPQFNKTDNVLENNFYKISNYTAILDLRKDIDTLWKSLEKKSIRWGIKKAEKEGVKIEEVKSEKDLREFYQIYLLTSKKGKLSPEKYQFFSQVQKRLVSKGKAKILVAKKGREIVSGAIALISDDHIVLNLTGTNEKGQKSQANILIYWKLIQLGKKLKKKWFDLGGYDKEAKLGDKSYNINKFKERFGGEITEQPVYTLNFKYYFARKIIGKFHFLKRLFLK